MEVKILLADDHAIVREGIRSLIEKESDMKVVGEAGEGTEVVLLARELKPDIIIMDVNMPGMDGIDTTRLITSELPNVKVVALSIYPKKSFIRGMLEAGASGYVLKNGAFNELVKAIKTVRTDEVYLCPKSTSIVVDEYTQSHLERSGFSDLPLTDRERKVLKLFAEGKTSKEIALIIGMSAKTVDACRRQIMEKLDVRSLAELVKYAIRNGLTSLDT